MTKSSLAWAYMATLMVLSVPDVAHAQAVLGTFHWQLQPYCNTLTLTVVQDSGGIRVQGTEDLCEDIYIPQPVEGSAVLLPGNSAAIGLSSGVAGAYSFEASRIHMQLDIATLNGGWSDNAGRAGALVRVAGPRNAGLQRGNGPLTFLHIVGPANRPSGVADNISCFSHPLTNGNPNAQIVFSPNRGSQTNIRPYVPSTVSLYYDDNGTGLPGGLSNNVWCLSRDDSATMPLGAGFTIRVLAR